MSSKRNLKKAIRYTCGDVAAECLIARNYVENIDADAMNAIICKLADLQTKTLPHCSVSFDHVPSDFANRHEYRKALRAFRRQAYGKLRGEFNNSLAAIVKEMNEQLPQAQKEANKKAAR
ncbi:MAG: hypothetical protein NC336_04660 [Clostridium sp.]|nr:hypothetical protein [Clostridium sp.]